MGEGKGENPRKHQKADEKICLKILQCYTMSRVLPSNPKRTTNPPPQEASRTKKKGGRIRHTSGSNPDTQSQAATARAFRTIEEEKGAAEINRMGREELKAAVRERVENQKEKFHSGQFDVCWNASPFTNHNPGRPKKQT